MAIRFDPTQEVVNNFIMILIMRLSIIVNCCDIVVDCLLNHLVQGTTIKHFH